LKNTKIEHLFFFHVFLRQSHADFLKRQQITAEPSGRFNTTAN